MFRLFILFCFCAVSTCFASETLFLKDNLQKANRGDFLVISSDKTETLMHIYDKQNGRVVIEEIAIPESTRAGTSLSWKEWVKQNAPGNTSWVLYEIDLTSGQMVQYYSFTKRGWFEIPEADNILSKLLNLQFSKIPEKARKKVGPQPTSGPDWRPLWQPRLVVDGHVIKGVAFDAWTAKWPRDGGDLAGKTIEVYLPQDNQRYPSYFPYWLQITGMVGKAKIRIIDSGSGLVSPKPSLTSLSAQFNMNGSP